MTRIAIPWPPDSVDHVRCMDCAVNTHCKPFHSLLPLGMLDFIVV